MSVTNMPMENILVFMVPEVKLERQMHTEMLLYKDGKEEAVT